MEIKYVLTKASEGPPTSYRPEEGKHVLRTVSEGKPYQPRREIKGVLRAASEH